MVFVQLVCAGCGVRFTIREYFAKKGQTFCSRICAGGARRREQHPRWRGSAIAGYRGALSPRTSKVVSEHTLIAEAALGKPLPLGVEIHHVNEIKSDNRPENLVICEDHKYHKLLHARRRVLTAGGVPGLDLICGRCRAVKRLTEFNVDLLTPFGRRTICAACRQARRRKGAPCPQRGLRHQSLALPA